MCRVCCQGLNILYQASLKCRITTAQLTCGGLSFGYCTCATGLLKLHIWLASAISQVAHLVARFLQLPLHVCKLMLSSEAFMDNHSGEIMNLFHNFKIRQLTIEVL